MWVSRGDLGQGTSNSSGLSFTFTTSQAINPGDLAVVIIALDNANSTDVTTAIISAVSHDGGTTPWTSAGAWTNGQGAGAAGAAVTIWYLSHSKTAAAIASGATVTMSVNGGAVTAKAATAWLFGSNGIRAVPTHTTLAADNAAAGSLAAPSPTLPGPFLYVRGTASEAASAQLTAATAGWTLFTNADGGGASTAGMQACGEWLISRGSSATSNPTSSNADHASMATVFSEVGAGGLVSVGVGN